MSDPDHHDQSGDNDRVTEEWKTNLIRKMSDENSSQKTVKVFMHIFFWGGSTIAHWICLCLPTCGPMFYSRAHHLCFFPFNVKFCALLC